jgi:hypothetical protein
MDIYKSCQKLLKFVPGLIVDNNVIKDVNNAIFEHLQKKQSVIAKINMRINKKHYDNLYDALAEIEKLSEIELKLAEPDLNAEWFFNVPTPMIRIIENGLGWISILPKDMLDVWDVADTLVEERCMFRVYSLAYHDPKRARDAFAAKDFGIRFSTKLELFEDFWKRVREIGVIPFTIRLCAYTKTARYLYDIDLLTCSLLKDMREGKIPPVCKISRKPLQFYQLDKIMTYDDLPLISKHIFEIIFESKEVNVLELAQALHITEHMVREHLDVLIRRRYVEKEGLPPNEKFYANMKYIMREGESI